MADQEREQWGRGRSEGGGQGRRSGGPRDGGGGFRIRLSDNELQAARTLQEAFQLRSTVAVLGFSLRTMAQLLEQGALDEVISQQRRNGGGGGGGGRSSRGERRSDDDRGQRGARPNPFARPSKPAPEPEPEEPAVETEPEISTEGTLEVPAEDSASSESVAPEAESETAAEPEA